MGQEWAVILSGGDMWRRRWGRRRRRRRKGGRARAGVGGGTGEGGEELSDWLDNAKTHMHIQTHPLSQIDVAVGH